MSLKTTLEKLETLVQELESESLDLEASADKYQKVVKLAQDALEKLSKVEEKLRVIQAESPNKHS